MQPLAFNRIEDNNGKMITVKAPTAPGVTLFAALPLFNSDAFKDAITRLFNAANDFGDFATTKLETFNEMGWLQIAKDAVTSTIQKPFQALIKAGTDRIAELDKRRADWLTMIKLDPAKEAELRDMIRTYKTVEGQARFLLGSPEASTAALNSWDLTGLPDTLRASVENTLILHNLTNRFASQTKLQPTLADPLAHGVDMNEGAERATQAVDMLKANWAEIDMVRALLSSTINFTAVATGMNAHDAFALLTGNAG